MAGLLENKERKGGLFNSQWSEFEEALSSITSALLKRIDTIFQASQAGNNEIHGNTELQSSSGGLSQELGKEKKQQKTIADLTEERKMKVVQEALQADDLFPEEPIFLQKVYNIQSQKPQIPAGVKKGRGIKVKKKVRKKEKKKAWRNGK